MHFIDRRISNALTVLSTHPRLSAAAYGTQGFKEPDYHCYLGHERCTCHYPCSLSAQGYLYQRSCGYHPDSKTNFCGHLIFVRVRGRLESQLYRNKQAAIGRLSSFRAFREPRVLSTVTMNSSIANFLTPAPQREQGVFVLGI